MKVFRTVLLLTLTILLMNWQMMVPAQAISPRKVAVLPVINNAGYWYTADFQVIQDTIRGPFKFPYYELVSAEAANDAAKSFLAQHKGAKLSDEQTMTELAGILSADIVVVVEVVRVSLTEFGNFWDGDYFLKSDIILKCYAFGARDKEYQVMKVTRFRIEPFGVDTNAPAFFKELTEQILVKLPYKRIPIGE